MAVERRLSLRPSPGAAAIRHPLGPRSQLGRQAPATWLTARARLGPIYYENPFWLIKKVFQSLRTGHSEISFSLLSWMGVGENMTLCSGKEGTETECGGERVRTTDLGELRVTGAQGVNLCPSISGDDRGMTEVLSNKTAMKGACVRWTAVAMALTPGPLH